MDCEQAIYEKNYLNKYLIVIGKNRKATCKLDNKNKFEIRDQTKGIFVNKLNENEKNAEEKIKKFFDEPDKFGGNFFVFLNVNTKNRTLEKFLVRQRYFNVYQGFCHPESQKPGNYFLCSHDP